ncbi:hypothetical protein RB195_020940 [Necator americanus]|uniref:Uncharacterized protein n=1 Tax=Necator americanus TaxID=51031 RepID=A0ABR1CM53_NECAM
MYEPYRDRYPGGDDECYSSFPDQAGRGRFIERDPDDFHRYGRQDIVAPPMRDDGWRSSPFVERTAPFQRRSYESWKSARATSWREEPRGDSWRRGVDEHYREYPDRWRDSSSFRPMLDRSPSPKRFVDPSREYVRAEGRRPDWKERSRETSFGNKDRYARGERSRSRSANREEIRNERSDSVIEKPLKNLSDEDLEKAAILQMKLMAEQRGGEGKAINAHDNNKQELDDNQYSDETSQNHLKFGKMTDQRIRQARQENPPRKDVEHSYVENETAAVSKKSSETKQDKIAEAKKTPNKKTEEVSLIVKADFEDVHMFAKHKIYDTSAAAPHSGCASWYEQYLMNVNKRKQELSGLTVSPPLSQTPSSCGRVNGPRYPPQVPAYVPGSPTALGGRSAPRGPSQMSSSSSSPMYLTPKQELLRKTSTSGALIDPNQYIEELSDNEDFDSVGRLVPKIHGKRPADTSVERPLKRGLLGAPPSPNSPPMVASRDPWQRPAVLASKPSYSKPNPSKSFFRMEFPSVSPRIYFSHKLGEQEDESGEAFPPQARIAPAAPFPRDDGNYTSWRRLGRPSRPDNGAESSYGGYFH